MQEELLYDHLLAAARVDEWLDAVRFKSKPREVRRDALAHLARHVLASDLYFEVRNASTGHPFQTTLDQRLSLLQEARIQRASEVLTKALSSTTDEDLLDLISTALTAW